MRAAVVNVQIADLPRVKATLDEARRRLREQEDTTQRLIAQAARQASSIEALAFEAWSGTQRCTFCPRGYCERCQATLDLLTAAGFDVRMHEWAGA